MITLSLRFLAGRYHATPWGRHVNEGAVEWPPSPWRILRALVATWKRTLPDLPKDQVEPTLRLLSAPPEFILPPASTGHSRHYMPWFKKGPYDRTLVFDTFVALSSDAPLLVRWRHASLGGAERSILVRILANMNTLGRSESWCEAHLVDSASNSAGFLCVPVEDTPSAHHEIVRLLCLDPKQAWENSAFTNRGSRKRARRLGGMSTGPARWVPEWHLCADTLWLHAEKWSDPPGSRWVPYARPRDCLKVDPHRRSPHFEERPPIQAVRYALDSRVLPLVTETLPVAEAARRALMSIQGRLTEKDGIRGRSMTLSGKNDDNAPLVGHRHAYYLPTDEDGDGRLDHLTVYAACGFGPDERQAFDLLRQLRTGRQGEESDPLRLLLLGMGVSDDYSPGPLQESAIWVSATPYIATRYAKTRGRTRSDIGSPDVRAAFLTANLREQIADVRPDLTDGIEQDVTVEPLWDDNHVFRIAKHWRPIQFRRFRRKAGDDGGRRLAGAFRLTFPTRVPGPIVLGWSSHFGMGLFVPEGGGDSR